ncbi:MAG: helix-turn-helix domain-containing protein, partial [Bacteroidota bacterium]
RNMTERAIMLSKGNALEISDFRIKPPKSEIIVPSADMVNLKAHEIKMIRKVLQDSKYNQQTAADLLGITRDALARKMKKYDISICKSEA